MAFSYTECKRQSIPQPTPKLQVSGDKLGKQWWMILTMEGHNDDSDDKYGPGSSITSSRNPREITEKMLLKNKKIHGCRNTGKGSSIGHWRLRKSWKILFRWGLIAWASYNLNISRGCPLEDRRNKLAYVSTRAGVVRRSSKLLHGDFSCIGPLLSTFCPQTTMCKVLSRGLGFDGVGALLKGRAHPYVTRLQQPVHPRIFG